MVPSPFNYICLVLNIFLPGTGTIMSAFFARPVSKTQIALGILQFATSGFFYVGWVWSIIWGVLIVLKSWGNPDAPTLL